MFALTKVHDVDLVAVDEKLEWVAEEEDQDDANEDGGNVKVPEGKKKDDDSKCRMIDMC